jgi:DNA-binding NarL/FixJ family response regulator
MPGLDGIEAARQFRRSHRPARLVFLTVHEDADYARAPLDAGGLGYVVKARLASDLLPPSGQRSPIAASSHPQCASMKRLLPISHRTNTQNTMKQTLTSFKFISAIRTVSPCRGLR